MRRLSGSTGRVVNFGGNITFRPARRYSPRSEIEVLEILDRHADGTVRVLGALHSWNEGIASDDVVVDIRRFDRIDIERPGAGDSGPAASGSLRYDAESPPRRSGPDVFVTVGAGCTIERLLARLRSEGVTLPVLPAVSKMTIGGAVATGTHGSGRPSLSHYVESVRFAAYDSTTGRARLHEWSEGPRLRAARCALGCTGILLSVRFRCVPEYAVAEKTERCATLDAVLAGEAAAPLQQFALVPYRWEYIAYRRTVLPLESARVGARTLTRRVYRAVAIDTLFHIITRILASPATAATAVRWFYQRALPWLVYKGAGPPDRGDRILLYRHHWFSHIELELFVPRDRLAEAVRIARGIVDVFADASATLPDSDARALDAVGMLDELSTAAGTYVHHYPIFFRRVLPDDTLISMTAGEAEPCYTMSLFCYRPGPAFERFATCLARSLARLCQARPHWGKLFPLSHAEIHDRYPHLPEFRRICASVDPRGVFHNDFIRRVLGF